MNESAPSDKLIVVVGAGSTATSTAYHLAKSGRRVVLVDRGQIASGMTSLSTAVVRTHYSNEIVARMVLYSLQFLRDSFSSIGNSGFVKSGMLIISPKELESQVLSNVSMLSCIGIESQVINIDDANKMFPDVNLDGCSCVVYEPESGYADPVGTANGFASAARELGVEILLEKAVMKLETQGEGNKVVGSVILSDGTRIIVQKSCFAPVCGKCSS